MLFCGIFLKRDRVKDIKKKKKEAVLFIYGFLSVCSGLQYSVNVVRYSYDVQLSCKVIVHPDLLLLNSERKLSMLSS